ncbi:3'-5' exonuclease [uncultured Traorella sp.]|uniref:3'-5' exonuclease n=1 Tax=uncultured Traorella sp. TaxID=1929048 RepID=UPI0025D3868C|nr:3'-5' exonuclease [uncultured Traorella sp.]
MIKIKDYCVLDIETTGLSRFKDDILEIGCIKIRDHKIIDQMSVLINPHKPISPYITSINHITDEMVQKEGIELDEALIRLYDFIEDDCLVGHNLSFDMGFIRQKSSESLGLSFDHVQYDTLMLSRKRIRCENYKLSTVCRYYNIQNKTAHRALSDVIATYQVFECLMKEI